MNHFNSKVLSCLPNVSLSFLENKTIKGKKTNKKNKRKYAFDFKIAFKMLHNGEIKGRKLVKRGGRSKRWI